MTVTDFLLARCQENLDGASCTYEIDRRGAVRCMCPDPDTEVLTAVNQLSLVLWLAEMDGAGDAFLRMLADAHADHPDYRSEWHPLP